MIVSIVLLFSVSVCDTPESPDGRITTPVSIWLTIGSPTRAGPAVMTYCPVAIVANVPVAVSVWAKELGPWTATAAFPPVGTLMTRTRSPAPVFVELELLHAAAATTRPAMAALVTVRRKGRKKSTWTGVKDGRSPVR
jgi:hypothetical protein